jgi:hypothetical protein
VNAGATGTMNVTSEGPISDANASLNHGVYIYISFLFIEVYECFNVDVNIANTKTTPKNVFDQGMLILFCYYFLFICIMIFNLDVHMQSPHTPLMLYGSSRITGGFLRGRALGNVLNAADLGEMSEDILHPRPGKVFVYYSTGDPANLTIQNMKPTTFIKHDVTSSIQAVLANVADKYSPIRSKSYY